MNTININEVKRTALELKQQLEGYKALQEKKVQRIKAQGHKDFELWEVYRDPTLFKILHRIESYSKKHYCSVLDAVDLRVRQMRKCRLSQYSRKEWDEFSEKAKTAYINHSKRKR